MSFTWRDRADITLSTLFIVGHSAPTQQEVFDAYPFGERAYTPYKVWLEQVKRWKVAHAAGRNQPGDMGPKAKQRKVERAANKDVSQENLFSRAAAKGEL